MAQNTYKSNTFKKPEKEKKSKGSKSKVNFNLGFLKDPRFRLACGFFLMIVSVYLFLSLFSYLFTGKADQSVVEALDSTSYLESGKEASNWLGLYGAMTSHLFVYRWFGIAAFFIPPLLFVVGFKIVFNRQLLPVFSFSVFSIFSGVWICLLLGYMTLINDGASEWSFLGGGMGIRLAELSDGLFGWGTFLILILSLFVFMIFFFNITSIPAFQVKDPKPMGNDAILETDTGEEPLFTSYNDEKDNWPDQNKGDVPPVVAVPEPVLADVPDELELLKPASNEVPLEIQKTQPIKKETLTEPVFTVEEVVDTEKLAEQLVEEQGEYDPTLELSNFKFPPLELLNEYDAGKAGVSQEELNQNKDKIVATLVNFKIGIQSIKATIGPTVTLYEIVPDAGIKISRIKNLEDDIALSLAALGIRIIAPIPGKGTIGIEVPNKNREMVSIRSVFGTQSFAKTDRELPVALGKTISNEVMVIDLAKMPHLLVAGATGQGKSVGLNVILTSLIYKRHPSTLKFVLVDPKKVEMSVYSKLERHYLAKLPNSEEAIITDTKKVVHTLNSLCIEMENRYEILKDAGARNLKEYNAKFVARKLNPKEGHRFLPYIVLVIDELADLMMTAVK